MQEGERARLLRGLAGLLAASTVWTRRAPRIVRGPNSGEVAGEESAEGAATGVTGWARYQHGLDMALSARYRYVPG